MESVTAGLPARCLLDDHQMAQNDDAPSESDQLQAAPCDTPASCTACKQLGDAAFRQGAFHQAVDAYTAALECLDGEQDDPQLKGSLLANRCFARLKLGGQPAAALADAQQACRQRPRWGKAHFRLAQAHAACSNVEAAAASYRRAAELDPELEPAAGQALSALEKQVARQRCLVAMQGHRGAIYDVAVHPKTVTLGAITTQLVATGGADASVRLWCSSTGRQLQQLGGHADRVTCLRWSPCGALLASAALDGGVQLWQLDAALLGRAGSASATPSSSGMKALLSQGPVFRGEEEEGRISCLDFSPDGSLVATGSSAGHARLWSAAGDSSCHRKLSAHSGLVSSVCFSPCGSVLVSASGDGNCHVCSTATGECVADIQWDSGPVNACCFGWCRAAEDSTHMRALLLTCHVKQARREGRILLWDVVERRQGWLDGKLVAPVAALNNFQGKVTSLDVCCSRSQLARAAVGGSAASTGSELSASTTLLATACNDGRVRVFDLAAVATTPAENKLMAQEAEAPLLELVLPDTRPGGSSDASGPAGWQSGAMLQALHDRNLVSVSPDGSLLAVVGPDCRILIADLEGSSQQAQQDLALAAHRGPVRRLAWMGGGRRLLSAGEDGVARVWQVTPPG